MRLTGPGLRDRLPPPWLIAAVAVIVLALVGGSLVLPPILDSIAARPTATPIATVTLPQRSLPATVPPVGPTGEASFTRPTPSPMPTFASYTVQSGDSLNSIAHQYRTTARSIAWWNRGTYPSLDPESAAYEPNRLVPGWTLIVIPGVTVSDANPPSASPPPAP